MKEAIVELNHKVTVHDVPIPTPNADQVLIKVIYSGSNPKDWKATESWWVGKPHNTGDDIAGIVEAVGENVTEFKKGDRVAAFHEMTVPHGSFAEYAIAWAHTTFHIPKKTSFEEAATLPLAAMTAAIGLYQRLRLPEPWRATTTPIPLIIYGGATAVGAFAIKLARLSNIHPILVVAGRGEAFVEKLIDRSKGDAIIDYRKGDEATVAGLKDALQKSGNKEVKHALDAVAEHNSAKNLIQVLSSQGSNATLVLPTDLKEFPKSFETSWTDVGEVHRGVPADSAEAKAGITTGTKEFGYQFYRFFSQTLQTGQFSGHPYEVVPGGLDGVEQGLSNLRQGVNSGTKYVFKIADTKGAGNQ